MLRHAIDSGANSHEKDKVNARNISGECQDKLWRKEKEEESVYSLDFKVN